MSNITEVLYRKKILDPTRDSLSLSLLVGWLVTTPVAHPQDVCKGKEEEKTLCVLDDVSQKEKKISQCERDATTTNDSSQPEEGSSSFVQYLRNTHHTQRKVNRL